MDPGDLVVAVVVVRPAESVEGGRGVAPLGEPTGRTRGRVPAVPARNGVAVAGVQGVPRLVQGVTGVFGHKQVLRGDEGDVVESGVPLVPDDGDGDPARPGAG